jgi:hypothetical protein
MMADPDNSFEWATATPAQQRRKADEPSPAPDNLPRDGL